MYIFMIHMCRMYMCIILLKKWIFKIIANSARPIRYQLAISALMFLKLFYCLRSLYMHIKNFAQNQLPLISSPLNPSLSPHYPPFSTSFAYWWSSQCCYFDRSGTIYWSMVAFQQKQRKSTSFLQGPSVPKISLVMLGSSKGPPASMERRRVWEAWSCACL